MIQQETLQELFKVRLDLENRLMDLTPGDDPEKEGQYHELVRRREQIFMTINQVLAAEFNEVFSDAVEAPLKQLAAATQSLQAIATTFQEINGAIGTVDEILEVVQQVVTIAANVGV